MDALISNRPSPRPTGIRRPGRNRGAASVSRHTKADRDQFTRSSDEIYRIGREGNRHAFRHPRTESVVVELKYSSVVSAFSSVVTTAARAGRKSRELGAKNSRSWRACTNVPENWRAAQSPRQRRGTASNSPFRPSRFFLDRSSTRPPERLAAHLCEGRSRALLEARSRKDE